MTEPESNQSDEGKGQPETSDDVPVIPIDYRSGKGIDAVGKKFEELRRMLEQLPAARYRSLTITALETSYLWFGRATSGRGW